MTGPTDAAKQLMVAAGTGREHEEVAINRYCSLVAPDVLWLTRSLGSEPREVRLLAARTLLALGRTTTAEESHPATQAAAGIRSSGYQSIARIGCLLVLGYICGGLLFRAGVEPILILILLVLPFWWAWKWVADGFEVGSSNPHPIRRLEDDGHTLAAFNRLLELGDGRDPLIRSDCAAALTPILSVLDEYDSPRIRIENKERMVTMAGNRTFPFQFRLELLKCLGRIGNQGCLVGLVQIRNDSRAEDQVRDAAQRAAEAIYARQGRESLLRPAAVPGDEALLRPAGGSASDGDMLLRPTQGCLE